MVPALGELCARSGAETAVDLFTGTTRVAQEFKRRGLMVTATDIATYSEVLAQTYISTDAREIDQAELVQILEYLAQRPGKAGYFTETFCVASRFFQPKNGQRIDAIRQTIEDEFKQSAYYPILLTSLMEAADRVDSTTGLQMAYLKQWAPRSYNDLELRIPAMLPGAGLAQRGDACELVQTLPHTDLMYLDPPYNQHRYFTNYHIWETLIRWDSPSIYGVACKRVDAQEEHTKSVFNKKRQMAGAFFEVLKQSKASILIISYNDESWITVHEMMHNLHDLGYADVRLLEFDYKRYVGAQIGIYNPQGEKVGKVKKLKNVEYLFIAGPETVVQNMCAADIGAKS